jgi:hypothetical protein
MLYLGSCKQVLLDDGGRHHQTEAVTDRPSAPGEPPAANRTLPVRAICGCLVGHVTRQPDGSWVASTLDGQVHSHHHTRSSAGWALIQNAQR